MLSNNGRNYGLPFSSVRPSWLKNPETGGILEIDCYNQELKIGVEYNGIQHYVYPNVYHKSLIEFKNQVRRDQFKIKKCEENGIYLITVPYNVPHHKLREFIIAHLPNDAQSDEGEDDQEDSREEGSEVTFSEMQSAISDLNEEIHQVFSNNRNIPTSVCYKEYLA